MPLIRLTTTIEAPLERCFDLARSIEFHQKTTEKTDEKAVAGVTSALIGLHETVTWEATHFGVRQHLTVEIVEFEPPHSFRDVMLEGAFAMMNHLHTFEYADGVTTMIDDFRFKSPLGLLGMLVDAVFLTHYMRTLLLERNRLLKEVAESDDWRLYLPPAT